MSDDLLTVSFFGSNVHPLVVEYQRRVFDHLGYSQHKQVQFNGSHGGAIDEFLSTESWDNISVFDIDAIPLSHVWEKYFDPNGVVGGCQRASHIVGSDLYASAAWVMFSRELWEEVGRPSFKAFEGGDTASALTYRARDAGRNVVLIWPSDVEHQVSTWAPLEGDIRNGMGTTWGGVVYHAFGSRFFGRSSLLFLRRARRVLGLPPTGVDVLAYQARWLATRAGTRTTSALRALLGRTTEKPA